MTKGTAEMTPEAMYQATLTAFFDGDLDALARLADLAYAFPVLAPAFARAMRESCNLEAGPGRPA